MNQTLPRQISFHSFSISSHLCEAEKLPTKNAGEFVAIFSCPKKMPEPSNIPRYPHEYHHLKPRLNDKHWYWNPYDFGGDVCSQNGGSPTPGESSPSYVITMAVMATASLSNLPRGRQAIRSLTLPVQLQQWRSNHACENVSTCWHIWNQNTTCIKFVTSMSYVKSMVWCVYIQETVFVIQSRQIKPYHVILSCQSVLNEHWAHIKPYQRMGIHYNSDQQIHIS